MVAKIYVLNLRKRAASPILIKINQHVFLTTVKEKQKKEMNDAWSTRERKCYPPSLHNDHLRPGSATEPKPDQRNKSFSPHWDPTRSGIQWGTYKSSKNLSFQSYQQHKAKYARLHITDERAVKEKETCRRGGGTPCQLPWWENLKIKNHSRYHPAVILLLPTLHLWAALKTSPTTGSTCLTPIVICLIFSGLSAKCSNLKAISESC